MVSMSLPDFPSDAFLFEALMENTADSIYFKDRQCRLLRASRKMAQDLGFSDPAELVGKTDIDLFGEAFGRGTRLDDIGIMETGRPIIGIIESRQLDKGRTNWTLTTKLPLRDRAGAVMGLVGITREINELREATAGIQHFAAAFQHLATHDTLTDLPNRYLLEDRLNQLLVGAKRSGTTFAVLYLDIDHFKEVNDSHGHEFGDLLLRAAARRLTRSVPQSGTVARIGGDEFVIVLKTIHEVREAETVALKVLRAIATSFTLQKKRLNVTASIGISFYPENGSDPNTLLRAADDAMYLAKREGGNRHIPCLPRERHPGAVLANE